MKILRTDRLILRRWQDSDTDDLFEIMKRASVIDGGWEPHSDKATSAAALKKYVADEGRWAVELKDGGRVIGGIGLSPDSNRGKLRALYVNFVLSESYRGNGYMTEAVHRVVKYAFEELNADLLSAFHIPDNIRSKKVLESCDFEYETTIPGGYKRFDGRIFDTVCYSILRESYQGKFSGIL